MLPSAPKQVLEEIAQEYEQTLDIPAHKSLPQWMLMPVGMMGAGKTTIVKPLAEHFHLLRISTDELRERLKRRGYSYAGAREASHKLTMKYLNLAYSIAIDGNTGSKVGHEYNKESAHAFPRVLQLYIHIDPPEEFILRHLQAAPKVWLFKNSEDAVEKFYIHKKEYVLPDIPFVYRFDPSRDDFPEQLKEGIEALEKTLISKGK